MNIFTLALNSLPPVPRSSCIELSRAHQHPHTLAVFKRVAVASLKNRQHTSCLATTASGLGSHGQGAVHLRQVSGDGEPLESQLKFCLLCKLTMLYAISGTWMRARAEDLRRPRGVSCLILSTWCSNTLTLLFLLSALPVPPETPSLLVTTLPLH